MPPAAESSIKNDIKTLGVIAGAGTLPNKLLHACDQKGMDVFVIGFQGQTSKLVYEGRNHMQTRLGAAGQIVNTLKSHEIRDLVLVGSITRPSLQELRPDMRTAKFFARLGMRVLGDDGLLKALREELEQEGFRVHGVQDFAGDLLTSEGILGRYKPKKPDWEDVKHGITILRDVGKHDIGQAMIIQEGMVLGVEAIEGTDELIKRCSAYQRKGRKSILIKLSKPGQDENLDLPTIGPQTIRHCVEHGIGGVVVEAGRSILLEPQIVSDLANEAKIFVVGVNPDNPDHAL